jgi:predicted NAD/FAD-dependent oxidoreductase
VTKLRKLATGWSVETSAGPADAKDNGHYDSVIMAVPAPQAQTIFERSDVHFPALASVRYAPCWALMLALEAPLRAQQLWWRPEGGDIAWIARNGTKPQRAGETLVVHASPVWSRDHLELTPDEALKHLLPKVSALLRERIAPIYATAHRWRYALVEQAVGQACLWNEELRIGACGDWCLGPRVECAYDSGRALAQMVMGVA